MDLVVGAGITYYFDRPSGGPGITIRNLIFITASPRIQSKRAPNFSTFRLSPATRQNLTVTSALSANRRWETLSGRETNISANYGVGRPAFRPSPVMLSARSST